MYRTLAHQNVLYIFTAQLKTQASVLQMPTLQQQPVSRLAV